MVKKTVYDGIKFDSKGECNRYKELKLLVREEKIYGLKLQHRFKITIGGVEVRYPGSNRHLTYVADFTYYDDNGKYTIEDFKGHQSDVSKIKIALMAAMGNEVILIKSKK